MDAARRPLLTTRQAECLRLVPVTSGSKEIAARLGIEPGTVDQHIKAATKALGESSRHAAARKWADLEARETIQKLDSQAPPVAPPPAPLPPEPHRAAGQPFGADWMVQEAQAPFTIEHAPRDRGLPWPIATRGRPRNELTWTETLAVSWVLSVVLGVAAGAVVAGVVLLMTFLIDVSRHGG